MFPYYFLLFVCFEHVSFSINNSKQEPPGLSDLSLALPHHVLFSFSARWNNVTMNASIDLKSSTIHLQKNLTKP